MKTRYTIFRENFAADTWEPMRAHIEANDPERAVRVLLGGSDVKDATVFGTYVAIPTDEFTQFMEGRPRTIISAHVETLHPADAPSTVGKTA